MKIWKKASGLWPALGLTELILCPGVPTAENVPSILTVDFTENLGPHESCEYETYADYIYGRLGNTAKYTDWKYKFANVSAGNLLLNSLTENNRNPETGGGII